MTRISHMLGSWPENQQPPDGVWSNTESIAFDTLSTAKMRIGLHYGNWNPAAGGVLETDLINDLANCRAAVQVAWPAGGRPADIVAGTISGKYDSVIQNVAGQLERARVYHAGRRMEWRPFWEMNGAWMDWYPGNNGNDPTLYVSMFRRVVNVAKAAGYKGTFIWAPHWNGSSNQSWNDFSALYPGDAYVDQVGASIYNNFPVDTATWRDFSTLVTAPPNQSTGISQFALSHGKTLQMAEGSSLEDPGNTARKGQWIDNMQTYLDAHPEWKTIIWFHRAESTVEPTKNYRVDTTAASLAAWRRLVNGDWAHTA